jgi:hypothetical protein
MIATVKGTVSYGALPQDLVIQKKKLVAKESMVHFRMSHRTTPEQ